MRTTPGLFDLGKSLLDLPAPVALLKCLGQTTQVAEGERRDVDPHREGVRPVRACELEGAEATECASERRVPSEAFPEPERPRRLGEVEVESVSVHFEPIRESPQEPRRRRTDDPEPVELDVARARVDSVRIGDRIEPADHPECGALRRVGIRLDDG